MRLSHPSPHTQDVCADSAKVRLNNGILQRRYQAWDTALEHFTRAQEVEPGYCEPDYWIGATLVRRGRAVRRIRDACSDYRQWGQLTTP